MTYYVGNGYWVDLVTDAQQGECSSWLFHERYGVKMLLLGAPFKEVPTIERMRWITENNLHEGIKAYKQDVIDN